ncbi:MAG: DUF5982 domain-containing protein [Pseudomonadota bacterium]
MFASRLKPLLALLVAVCPSFAASAQEVKPEAGSGDQPPFPFMSRKRPLPDLTIKEKKENGYFTAIPLFGWDPDTGVNYGAEVDFFNNKTRDDPLFRYTPYRQKLSISGLTTSRGIQDYFVYYDRPYIADTPWRIKADAGFYRNPIQGYYGVGDASLEPFQLPGTGTTFQKYGDYVRALEVTSGTTADTRFVQYRRTRADLKASAEYDLLGGLLRPLIGFQSAYYWVHDYTGEMVDAVTPAGVGVRATQSPTKLNEDCASGRIQGCTGGWDNYLKAGMTLDTRDYEPDPSSGTLTQAMAEISSKALGSSFEYQRMTFSSAGYFDLMPRPDRIVLAGRFLYSMQFGDVPVYSMATLAYSERDWEGLGGFRTLRGYRADRFIGKAAAMTNWEFRWRIGAVRWFDQLLRMTISPFWDSGRVFNKVSDTSLKHWQNDFGLGFRLAWNLATVICFDYAYASEGHAFYMELGYGF